MDELIQKLSEKTGLSLEEAPGSGGFRDQPFERERPAPLASGLDELLAGGSGDAGGESVIEKRRRWRKGWGVYLGTKRFRNG